MGNIDKEMEPEEEIRLQPRYIFSTGNYYCCDYYTQLFHVL